MSKRPVKQLADFFRTFPKFTYNPNRIAELEFVRLQRSQGLLKSDPGFKKIRRQFLEALVAETGSPVHTFFVNGYAGFDYDSGASPKQEFERLKTSQKWKASGSESKKAKTVFEKAFEKEFNSELDVFFRSFKDFNYNPREPSKFEFTRLTKKIQHAFFSAFDGEFSSHFGDDENNIQTWECLCRVLGVNFKPLPETIPECKERLRDVHVNIYDLVHHARTKAFLKFFDTEEGLSEYTRANNLRYPKEEAKNGALGFLLRCIDAPITSTYQRPLIPYIKGSQEEFKNRSLLRRVLGRHSPGTQQRRNPHHDQNSSKNRNHSKD